jgi:hypothetical protein
LPIFLPPFPIFTFFSLSFLFPFSFTPNMALTNSSDSFQGTIREQECSTTDHLQQDLDTMHT